MIHFAAGGCVREVVCLCLCRCLCLSLRLSCLSVCVYARIPKPETLAMGTAPTQYQLNDIHSQALNSSPIVGCNRMGAAPTLNLKLASRSQAAGSRASYGSFNGGSCVFLSFMRVLRQFTRGCLGFYIFVVKGLRKVWEP